MPDSFAARWPHVSHGLEICNLAVNVARFNASTIRDMTASWSEWLGAYWIRGIDSIRSTVPESISSSAVPLFATLDFLESGGNWYLSQITDSINSSVNQIDREWMADASLLDLFSGRADKQHWSVDCAKDRILMDLPSLRAIDISSDMNHRIRNYTVVFAPRAGHHSNIAEQVALHLRKIGLSRMVIVEQKCADDIPLKINGQRHEEGFKSQVAQYTEILEHLHQLSGAPSHLVAVCQPGPLLMATLILNPHLGQTFGSAGSPMHMEAQRGFLTDFARSVGPKFVDTVIAAAGRRVDTDRPGAGRLVYDGSLQVLMFYLLGLGKHLQNFRKLRRDLVADNTEAVRRQKEFYQWYNSVHHFPTGFMRDTFKQIFCNNALVKNELRIGTKTIGLCDYPAHVPVWAIGGNQDEIVPVLQATAHVGLLDQVPGDIKRVIHCDAGHMGLFRSQRVFNEYYSQVADFMLAHSNCV